jgi:hypothetical protein
VDGRLRYVDYLELELPWVNAFSVEAMVHEFSETQIMWQLYLIGYEEPELELPHPNECVINFTMYEMNIAHIMVSMHLKSGLGGKGVITPEEFNKVLPTLERSSGRKTRFILPESLFEGTL